jgi:predicted  nucleic acid-binding Zn-ribbon protein
MNSIFEIVQYIISVLVMIIMWSWKQTKVNNESKFSQIETRQSKIDNYITEHKVRIDNIEQHMMADIASIKVQVEKISGTVTDIKIDVAKLPNKRVDDGR